MSEQEKVQDYVKKSHIIEENEPKSEKTTQDVQKNCSSLTEKWKNGELKEGAYYVRNEQGVIFTAENYVNYDCFNDTKIYDFYNVETDIKEILAPVPSYEEWQKLKEENDKLKELLKRCRDFINYEVPDHCIDDILIDKIDEVLE